MFSRCAPISRMALVALMVFSAVPASAQDPDQPSPALDVFKQVVFDPTTYAPAILSGAAQHMDWKSSQVFFEHGFLERNPAFTVSGRAGDTPMTYEAGNKKIVRDAFVNLGTSVVNNVTMAVVERLLIKRYPKHPKLVRALGWTERIGFASWLSYQQSATYFRQWQRNGELARQLGY